MTDRFLRLPEVMACTGLSKRTIYLRMNALTFPASVRLGPNAVAWRESDVSAWMTAPAEWSAAA